MKLKMGNDALEIAKTRLCIDRVLEDVKKMEPWVELDVEEKRFVASLVETKQALDILDKEVLMKFNMEPTVDLEKFIGEKREELGI